MKNIPVLGIPYYNRPDLLRRCLASIDYPVDRLVVVDQGPTPLDLGGWRKFLDPLPHLSVVDWILHPNAGVAGAWNEIVKLFPAPWWLLVNNDIQFAREDLRKLSAEVRRHGAAAGLYYSNHGASCFALTDACIAKVGLFDENLYPAYLEDCDYSHRLKLAGVRAVSVPGLGAIHGDGVDAADGTKGSQTIMSDPDLRRRNGITHGHNFEYYRAKWGGNNGEEKYDAPFNNPSWPVWAWRFEPGFRAMQVQALKG